MVAAIESRVDRASGQAFAGLARNIFGNVRIDFGTADQAKSRMTSAMLGTCRLTHLEADRHVVFGEHVLPNPGNSDAIKLFVQTEGRTSIMQGGIHAPISKSALVIYDPSHPYKLKNSTPVRQLLLQLPRHSMPESAIHRLARPFMTNAENDGMCRILFCLIDKTMHEIDYLEGAGRSSIGQTMIDLVRTMLVDDAKQFTNPLDLLLKRVKEFIDANLSRPDLSVRMVARRMGCSVRYIYRAFELERLTPSEYIWDLRLQRAAEHLRESGGYAGEISGIAFSLGFSSSAHFSRTFRNRYGISPSQWRNSRIC